MDNLLNPPEMAEMQVLMRKSAINGGNGQTSNGSGRSLSKRMDLDLGRTWLKQKTYGSWGVLDGLGDLVRQITDSRLCSATSGSSSHALCFQHIKSWQETHQGAPSAAKSSDPAE
jgi:hypothetical protein